MRQNELISNGTISEPGSHYLHMNILGIINGCIDLLAETSSYITFPNNNTYGLRLFNDTEFYYGMYEFSKSGGAADQIKECRRLVKEIDRGNHGEVDRVSEQCAFAMDYANNISSAVYQDGKKAGWFDITHPAQDPFPPEYFMGFLNQPWVQQAMGSPVNHSFVSMPVMYGFSGTGDMARGGLLHDLAYILDHGVKVAMLYGDRDYACNWVQGERSSLEIPWSSQSDFEKAGYTPLVISPVQSGGLTRQYGNLSFTRVYQAGHLVPSYQPEVAYYIFMRAVLGKDIPTGLLDLQDLAVEGETYSTEGPGDTWSMKSDVLPAPSGECYVLDIGRCTPEEIDWIFDGTAVVRDLIVVGRNDSLVDERRAAYVDQMTIKEDL